MRTAMVLSLVCLTGFARTAVTQQTPAKPRHARQAATGIKLADVAGTWTIESTVKTAAGNDTTVTSELVATATRKGWKTNLAGRDSIPTRVVAMGGDSVVVRAGPFESVVRAGQKVSIREALHFKGDDVSGTIEAHYVHGAVVKGSVKGTRKK